jgi:flagellar M-ring protein FliF
VICLIVIVWMLSRPNYKTVVSGLDDKSLGEVQTKLQDLKIPDKIVGTSVEVPASQADTARVQLAMNGLPKSGYIGYSSITNSFGMTQDQFNIQVLDALQQSLNQTIESMDGIDTAQVHIVMPDQQLFVAQTQNNAKASVFLQVGSGVRLSAAQVSGIQQLVAHSVKGLSPTDVTVSDQTGATLSGQADASTSGQASATNELDVRQQYEQKLTSQLTSQLNTIVGPGNAVVVVHAIMTFDQVQSDATVYTAGPPSSSSVSRETSNSTSGASSTVPAGQAGSNPGLPTYAGSGGSGGASTDSKSSTVTNNQNSVTRTQKQSDPVQINGYTVGVLVNSQSKNYNTALANQIKSFVATAVGMSVGNNSNNNITVQAVPFNQVATTGFSKQNSNLWMWAAIGAGLLLLGGGWLVSRRRKQSLASVSEDIALPPLDTLEKLPASEDERMKDELMKLANHKPTEFASLLRTWLAGD